MGCDIHGYLEVKIKERWNSIKEIPKDRAYDMFGILADVRNYVNAKPISGPKGVPEDASDFVAQEIVDWDIDGHSHSWLTWEEISKYDWEQKSLDERVSTIEKATGKELSKASYTYLQDKPDPRFELKHLERIMKELVPQSWKDFFDDMKDFAERFGAENVRIVFWFDN